MEGAKACSRCGEMKPHSEFYKNASKKHGLQGECKKCTNRRANPEARQLSKMVVNSRARAKEKNLAHDIDVKYLRSLGIPSHCPYLGIKLRWKLQAGLGVKHKSFPESPSLDRIDSSKGYVKGNVIIVSHRANSIKRDADEQELYKLARNICQTKMNLACP